MCNYAYTHTHSLHFIARSPSPSSKVEITSLPFIEHSSQSSTSSSATDNHQGTVSFALGGFPFRRLHSEDDALSFSSLPTSQFALKPSSMDVECQEPSSFSWQKSMIGFEFGTFNQNDRDRSANLRQFGPSDYYNTSNYPLPSSAPNDTGATSGNSTSITSSKGASTTMQQQVHGHAEPVDMSRSSLSVADSKTIILSNAPSTTPSNDKLKQPTQQNTTQPNTRPTSLVQGNLALQSADNSSAASVAAMGVQGGSNSVNNTASSSNVTAQDSAGSASKGASITSASATTHNGSAAQERTDRKTSTALSSAETDNTTSSSSSTSAFGESTETKDKEARNAWLMSGPESGLLQLNKPMKHRGGSEETGVNTRHSVFATVNSALSVTTQFQQTLKKKEDLLSSNAVVHTHNSTVSRSGPIVPVVTSADAAPQPHLKQPNIVTTIGANTLKVASELSSDKVGLVDKRTSGIAAGQGLPTALVARRASTTNGTNYQEIFHTAHRISETTERGLKQALAG